MHECFQWPPRCTSKTPHARVLVCGGGFALFTPMLSVCCTCIPVVWLKHQIYSNASVCFDITCTPSLASRCRDLICLMCRFALCASVHRADPFALASALSHIRSGGWLCAALVFAFLNVVLGPRSI